MKRILLYGINFAPEPTGIGKYTGEMAAWLAGRGYEVRVVTAPPYYPAWAVQPPYRAGRYQTEMWQGVRVWRCPVWVPRQPGGLARVLHLLSFAFSSLPVMMRQVLWRPDLVWVCAPAFACTPGALLAARLAGSKAWLHVQDFEVDVAFDTGLLKGRLLRGLVTGLERWLLRRFDIVSSISQRMLARAEAKGVEPERIRYFPNWVDVEAVKPYTGRSPYRDELGLRDEQVVALFSGTLSAKQGLHLIPEVARQLAIEAPHVVLVIGGEGVMRAPLLEATADLPNVRMLPLQPKERLSEWLGMADVHLLTQDPDVADLVMPSKLTAMLSSGRAVVATARPGTELQQVVEACGRVVPPGETQPLVRAIAQLADDAPYRLRLGVEARNWAVANVCAERVLARFEGEAVRTAMSLPRSLAS